MTRPFSLGTASRALAASLALALALLGVGCAGDQEPARPAGVHLIANGEAMARALAAAGRLAGTPLGDSSADALEVAQSCPMVWASAPSGLLADLLGQLRCGTPADELAPLVSAARGAEVAIASGSGGPWSIFLGAVDGADTLSGELSFPKDHRGMATLLVPGASAPGSPVLSREGAALRGRMRVRGGVDVDKLKTKGKTSEKMKLPDFGGLMSGALLNGVWELAVYAPPPERTVPRLALALGVSSTRATRAAMDALLTELEQTWQLHRSAFRIGEDEGACLLDLTVLPDLAPCWLQAGDHLVIGWNQETLQHALAADRPRDETLAAGRFIVDFATMTPIDEALSRAAFPGETPQAFPYPWTELVLDGAGEGKVKLALRVRGATP